MAVCSLCQRSSRVLLHHLTVGNKLSRPERLPSDELHFNIHFKFTTYDAKTSALPQTLISRSIGWGVYPQRLYRMTLAQTNYIHPTIPDQSDIIMKLQQLISIIVKFTLVTESIATKNVCGADQRSDCYGCHARPGRRITCVAAEHSHG